MRALFLLCALAVTSARLLPDQEARAAEAAARVKAAQHDAYITGDFLQERVMDELLYDVEYVIEAQQRTEARQMEFDRTLSQVDAVLNL